MANLNSVDAMGSGINSPEALMMYEQFGRVGNSTLGQAFNRTREVDETQLIDWVRCSWNCNICCFLENKKG